MQQKTEEKSGFFAQFLIVLVAACLVFAVMQGVRNNYGIMWAEL